MKETIVFGLKPLTETGMVKTTREIEMDIKDLSALIFRFSPNNIVLSNGDKIIFRKDAMILLEEDYPDIMFAVTNADQVYNLAVQAYNRLVATQMFYNAISFDFEAASDFMFKDTPDEFGYTESEE